MLVTKTVIRLIINKFKKVNTFEILVKKMLQAKKIKNLKIFGATETDGTVA